MDSITSFGEYLDQSDWRVKENSNSIFTFGGLCKYVTSKATAEYWTYLYDLKNTSIMNAHNVGDMHIHDLGSFSSYCFGASIKDILLDGIRGAKNMATSRPPSRLRSVCSQIASLVTILQNEVAGAVAFSSVNVYLAPFLYFDTLRSRGILLNTEEKQDIEYSEAELQEAFLALESLIYQLNENSRLGAEAAFSNFTLDFNVTAPMQGLPVIFKGQSIDLVYGQFQKESDILLNMIVKIMQSGDGGHAPFTYPIITFNVGKQMDWSDKWDNVWAYAAKTGGPYFGNYINSPMDENEVYSMCCRLRLDKTELLRKAGGLFGAAERTGSIGVVTVNLPACAVRAKQNKQKLFEEIEKVCELGYQSLEIKREIIQHYFERGLYPALTQYLKRLNTLFSTIGLVGAHEMCMNLLGKGIDTDEGRQLTVEVVDFMRNLCQKMQERSGNLYNLEYTPAESTAYRLAKKDKQRYPTAYTSGTVDPYYTNSTHLPVDCDWSYTDILTHQHGLLSMATGGSAWHCYLKEPISATVAKMFIKKTFERFDIPYLSLSPLFSVCPSCGYLPGKQEQCNRCGQETELFQRITGYVRPVKNFNKGKQEEFKNRKQHSI